MRIGLGLGIAHSAGRGVGAPAAFSTLAAELNPAGQGGRVWAVGDTLTNIIGASRTTLSLAFWARRDAQDWTNNFPALFGSATDWSTWANGFAVYVSGNVWLFWINSSTIIRGVSVPDGGWHHYVFAWNGATQTFTSWRDGVATGTTTGTPPAGPVNVSGTQNISLGVVGNANHPVGDSYFPGRVDELALYGDVLLQADVDYIYHGGTPQNLVGGGAPDNLLAYYRMGEAVGDNPAFGSGRISDVSGNARHLVPLRDGAGTGTLAFVTR